MTTTSPATEPAATPASPADAAGQPPAVPAGPSGPRPQFDPGRGPVRATLRIDHADGTWRDYVVVNPREVAIEHPPPLGWVPYELAEGYLVRPPRQLVIRMVPQPFGVPLTVAEQPRQEPPEPPRNVAIRIAQALHEAHEGTRSLPVAWEELPIEMRAQLTNLAAELLRRRVILPGDGQ